MKIQLSKEFEYLLHPEKRKRFNIFYGGRGGGKTKSLMLFCMIEFLKHNKNILVLREFQVNNKDSVYAEFLQFVYDYGLKYLEIRDIKPKKLLDCSKTEIINNLTQARITFYGINQNNMMNLKSYSNYDVAWIEEAHYITKYALDILNPTIRNKYSYLLFSFNPQSEEDYIYKLALSDNEFIKSTKINYTENPFYHLSSLEPSRLLMLENVKLGIDTIENYNHHWLGEPAPVGIDCIFHKDVFKNSLLYDYDMSFKSYTQICLAIDPATTNKDYSNETGIILAGITKDSIVHVIHDYSDNMTPQHMAKLVSEIYSSIRIDCVVIETNNGGDFIKAVILNENPLIPIREVRANRDKKDRASPVAVLMGLQKVLVYDGASKKLFAQMKKLTTRGYLGLKGESPDRLDAMVWAVYHLLDLQDFDTKNTIFNTSLYKANVSGYVLRDKCAMGIISSNKFVVLEFQIILDNDTHKINFTECFIQHTHKLKEFLQNYTHDVYFQECNFCDDLGLLTYSKSELDLMEYAMNTIPRIQDNVNVFNVKAQEYNNYYGNLLIKNLDEFNLDTKENIITECFCDVINQNIRS